MYITIRPLLSSSMCINPFPRYYLLTVLKTLSVTGYKNLKRNESDETGKDYFNTKTPSRISKLVPTSLLSSADLGFTKQYNLLYPSSYGTVIDIKRVSEYSLTFKINVKNLMSTLVLPMTVHY